MALLAAVRRFLPTSLFAICAVVGFGFVVNTAIRLPCYDVCGSDIGRLYEDRGIDRLHPPYLSRDLEYPPLIGEVMYAAGAPFDHGLRGRFLVNALLLTGLAVGTTAMLWRRNGTRTWRWALSPPLLLQGLTNWDLLSVAPATMGLLRWENGFAGSAGLLLGVGAAAKLFPALYVPILAAALLGRRQLRRAVDLIGGFVVGLAALVLPIYALEPHALRFFVTFQGDRGADRGALWYWLFRTPANLHTWLDGDGAIRLMTVVSAVAIAGAVAALCVAVCRERVSPFAACAVALIVCLLTSKIYSPQYDLWIVPFFVLLPIRTKLVVNFYIASFLVFVLTASDDHLLHRPASGYVLGAAVVYRAVVLVMVAIGVLRPEPSLDLLGAERAEVGEPGRITPSSTGGVR